MSKRVNPRTLSPALQAIWAAQHGIDPPAQRTRVNDRSERMQVALNQKSKALDQIKAAQNEETSPQTDQQTLDFSEPESGSEKPAENMQGEDSSLQGWVSSLPPGGKLKAELPPKQRETETLQEGESLEDWLKEKKFPPGTTFRVE
jgi:hypothetical protein